MWAILSQRSVKSHVENHANDEYCNCCFEICLIVDILLEGINQKLILIVPKPLLGYNCMLFSFSKLLITYFHLGEMARAQAYIFFFYLLGYPNISTLKKKTMTSFGVQQKSSLVVFAAEIENPT
jgi:hypothetical protein